MWLAPRRSVYQEENQDEDHCCYGNYTTMATSSHTNAANTEHGKNSLHSVCASIRNGVPKYTSLKKSQQKVTKIWAPTFHYADFYLMPRFANFALLYFISIDVRDMVYLGRD